MYDDGAPGEIFITMAKEGSTISWTDGRVRDGGEFQLTVRRAVQVPGRISSRMSRIRAGGRTGNQQIPYAKSIMDYIFRWMGAKFLGPEYAVGEVGDNMTLRATEPEAQQALPFNTMTSDAPLCSECGSIMTRNGSCYKVRQLRRYERAVAKSLRWENRKNGPPDARVAFGGFFYWGGQGRRWRFCSNQRRLTSPMRREVAIVPGWRNAVAVGLTYY